MVEIPVEHKSNLKWLWLLLLLVFLGLLLWWAIGDDEAEIAGGLPPAAAVEGEAQPGAPAGSAAGGDATATAAASLASSDAAAAAVMASIPAILANPAAFVGRNDFAGEVAVPDVPTDRGFWVQQDGARLFALIIDDPREDPVDINAGQRLRVTNGMLRDGSSVRRIPGRPLDAGTERILQDQQIFLVVNEDNIEILSRPDA